MQRLFRFIPLIFASLYLASTPCQAAGSNLEIQPLRLSLGEDGRVSATFSQACGSSFAGFIYRNGRPGELYVGAVMQRSHARCLGEKAMIQRPLPLIRSHHFTKLFSLNPSLEPYLVQEVPLQNIHRAEGGILHGVYTSHCETAIGLMVEENSQGHVFGVLESDSLRNTPCTRRTEIFSLQGLDLSDIGRVDIKKIEKTPQLSYELRRVPIQLQAENQTKSGLSSYKVRYLRACNEAPIGLVQRASKGSTALSMLVARYPQMACPDQGPRAFWSPWGERFQTRADHKLLTLREVQVEKLRLVRPISYQIAKQDEGGTLSFKAFRACERDLGWVGRRGGSTLALGILQKVGSASCNSNLKKVTYRMELNADPVAEVKPLQLVGS